MVKSSGRCQWKHDVAKSAAFKLSIPTRELKMYSLVPLLWGKRWTFSPYHYFGILDLFIFFNYYFGIFIHAAQFYFFLVVN